MFYDFLIISTNMRKIILVGIVIFFYYALKGQTLDYYNSIVPPSPNVLALTKFGNIPVNYSTGIPQINVPIYQYEDKNSGLSLNISLDYHAGGVKVDEMASAVGIGWALNAGGVVSRTVRGISDESPKGYWNTNIMDINVSQDDGNRASDYLLTPFRDMHLGERDSQVDLFSYSINGRSGQFMWGRNNDLLIVNREKINITKGLSTIWYRTMVSKITITDEKGFRYVFDAPEVTTSGMSMSTSALYITKIYSPSGKDSISFEYGDTYYQYDIGRSMSANRMLLPTGDYNTNSNNNSISSQTIQGKRLQKIIFPNDVIATFVYNTIKRKDLDDYALSKIIIMGSENKKTFETVQDYTTNRLTLTKVLIKDDKDNQVEQYKFEYEGTLPDRLSMMQDHWGFYNNNSENDLIQKEYHMDGGDWYTIGTADRRTDSYKVKMGSLKRMYYPSGGYTDFEMESNEAIDSRLTREWREEIRINNKNVTTYLSSTPSSTTFIFAGDNRSVTKYRFVVPLPSSPIGAVAHFEIYDPNNKLILYHPCALNANMGYTNTFEFSTSLFEKGTYKIKSYFTNCSGFSYGTFEWVEDISSNPTYIKRTDRQLYVGGIRVKKIIDYDGISTTPAMVREYDYKLNGESSGRLGLYPKYSYDIFYDFVLTETPDPKVTPFVYKRLHRYLSASSSTVYCLSQFGGSPVIYTKVTEKITKNGVSEGFTEQFFKGFGQFGVVTDSQFPFTPAGNQSWAYGLLDSIKIYDKMNKVVKAEYNNYDITSHSNKYISENRQFNFTNLSIAPVIFGASIANNNSKVWSINWNPVYFLARDFFPEEGRAELVSKTTVNWENGYKISSLTSYTYNPYNRLLATETITGSKGENIVKNYTYTQDMINSGKDSKGIYAGMVGKGMNGVLIEEKKIVNNKQIELNRTNYTYNTNIKSYLPDLHEQYFEGTTPAKTIKCLSYTSNARIESYSIENNIPITLLWGYSQQYPIAKIENATIDDVKKALGGTIPNFGITGLSNSQISNLRTKLPATSLVFTYTYQPLVGMTSETDPSGVTTYYEYDSFGRLIRALDNNRNVLKQYEYNYKK